jgi:hypothetical protein
MIRTLAIASLPAAALTGGVVLFAAPSTEVKANTPSAKGDRLEAQRATNASCELSSPTNCRP